MPEEFSISVAFLITGLGYGGAEMQVVRLARRLKALDWNVSIISMIPLRGAGKEVSNLASDAGIPVYSLEIPRGIPDPRGVIRLARILRDEKPQVLHCHMVHANLLGRIVRLFEKVPVLVCTAHSTYEGGRHRELAYRLTDFLCDLTTQVSQTGLERYVKIGAVPRRKIRYVPNGVDVTRFRPDPLTRSSVRSELQVGDSFVWLAVGRFVEAKDYPNMFQAFAEVVKAGRSAVLLVAGDGGLRNSLEEMVDELGIRRRVRFLGIRRDIPSLMNAADGYVMSSAWEGLPMVLLEAAATGLPVVATDVGGNREAVIHGKTGFLVPPKRPDALARGMLRLMSMDPDDRKRMGQEAREYVVSTYSLEKVVNLWIDIYRSLYLKWICDVK